MKLLNKLIAFIALLGTSNIYAQDVSINILNQPSLVQKGSTEGRVIIDICNNDGGSTSTPLNKLRPLISLPSTLVGATLVPISNAGWTILSNDGSTIRFQNTVAIAPGACSQIVIGYTGVNEGGPSTATGTMGFNGPQTIGNVVGNDNSTTSITVINNLDTDNDNVPDTADLDDDNDGILDTQDKYPIDTDNDGIPNATDPDDDNDGLLDVNEPLSQLLDTDNDGTPNLTDTDDDNDGILDTVEIGVLGTDGKYTLPDVDGDGIPDLVDSFDSDDDNIPDTADLDDDNDGILDTQDKFPIDTDNDGIPNTTDPDDDGDGLLDVNEPLSQRLDTDNDGTPNLTDTDDDNDGILDTVEIGVLGTDGKYTLPDVDGDGIPDISDPLDSDNDNVPDTADLDDDNDGILDTVELAGAPVNGDSDGDGIKDSSDLDSDNDGINDVREAGGNDANGDGFADGIPNAQGIPSSAGTGLTPPDTDGDGQKDYQDLDSDNDTISDLYESGINATDTDGIVDGADTDRDGIKDIVDGKVGFGDLNDSAPRNTDSTDMPDYKDGDSNNDGINDIVTNGFGTLDTNGDGKVDNPTDPDKDGVANNGGVDLMPTTFGGVSGLSITTASINVKVLLQGALIGTTGTLMRDDLRVAGVIPNAQPYSALGATYPRLNHTGTETIGVGVLAVTGNNAIVDWVLVELRDANNPANVVKTKAALVQRDGDVVEAIDGVSPVAFTGVVGQSYYVSIKHRNHLGAMTVASIPMTTTGVTVDFTNMTASQMYNSIAQYDGYEQVNVNGKRALWAGNVNFDNKIKYIGSGNDQNLILNQVLMHSGNTTQSYNYDLATSVYVSGDINMDAKVKYRGSGNDANFILDNVYNKYLLNLTPSFNYDLFFEQIP